MRTCISLLLCSVKLLILPDIRGLPRHAGGAFYYFWYEYRPPGPCSIGTNSTIVKICAKVTGVLWVRALVFSE